MCTFSFNPDDGEKLCRDHAVVAKNLVELSKVAKQADSRYDVRFNIFPGRRWPVGLANMVEEYLNKKIDKGPIRLSNWENNPLTEEQKTCKLYPFKWAFYLTRHVYIIL